MERIRGLEETVATNVRAEMAAQKKTAKELSAVLGIGYRAASRRVHGEVPYSLGELHSVASWLGVNVALLMRTRESGVAA